MLGYAIQIATIRKGLDVEKAVGEAALKLIDGAGQGTSLASPAPAHIGKNLDIYA